MKQIYDVARLDWTITGYVPYEWQLGHSMELGSPPKADVSPVPTSVPGSVQKALLHAGVIPDWNIGMNARLCEWVENRHWVYETKLPDAWFASGRRFRLCCLGLDDTGEIYVNRKPIYRFANAQVPHLVDLTSHLQAKDNLLQIVFECPPRWLGQFYMTSKIRDYKPRFYYTWDWTSRLVQIGIWDAVFIEAYQEAEIADLKIETNYDGQRGIGLLRVTGVITGPDGNQVSLTLLQNETVIQKAECSAGQFHRKGFACDNLKVESWWPNGMGSQPLYVLYLELRDTQNRIVDQKEYKIGFKHVAWHPCQDAPAHADPWLCVVNSQPVFLQGVNWTPIRPNFADVTPEDYRQRLTLYRDLGINTLRVWGGAFLEKTCFYDLCDELGLMVWQEFPLSSSGLENYPPDDPKTIDDLCDIAASYVDRRHHHVSLLLWSGGNELTNRDKEPKPINDSHPLIAKMGSLLRQNDPQHRFVATSPTGPEFFAHQKNYGQGCHWDVHGPWKVDGLLTPEWRSYWEQDDALFRSEMGAPGPSSAALIDKYKGEFAEMPADLSNPLWRRTGWWAEGATFRQELGREPQSLEEYVQWGQQRQAIILKTAAQACKDRFPRCGGILIWMGHDSFPCAANTAIIDFEGRPKPAALAISEVFHQGK